MTFTDKQVANIYTVYEINLCPFSVGKTFALENSTFGAIKVTENTDFDKYKYCGYGIGFNMHAEGFCYLMVVGLVKKCNNIWCRYEFICVY